MNKASELIVLLNGNDPSVESLSDSLQSLGRKTAAAQNYEAIGSLCSDPLIQPLVISSKNTSLETPSQREQLKILATQYLVIVALSNDHLTRWPNIFVSELPM